jgi:uncharacterized protein (TIGR03083 family)
VKPLPPLDAVPLFPDERAALLDLLRSLSAEQWALPTVCAGWSVKDIAAHVIGDDVGRLAWQRDSHSASRFEASSRETFEAELAAFINERNEEWVAAARRLSSRMVIDLLEWSGRETQTLFESLDPEAMGLGVSWAGEARSANWFDLAREYTERWHHQAQIRDALGAPMLYEQRLFAPVLKTMVRAIPHALRDSDAPAGTMICVVIEDVPWSFDVVRDEGGWALTEEGHGSPDSVVALTGDTAWRLLTRNLPEAEILARCDSSGDQKHVQAIVKAFALVA